MTVSQPSRRAEARAQIEYAARMRPEMSMFAMVAEKVASMAMDAAPLPMQLFPFPAVVYHLIQHGD